VGRGAGGLRGRTCVPAPRRSGARPGLAADDEHHARLRETLLAFLQSGGSYKATAERLVLHKNTVQYRIRKVGF
jgi:DNA-binding PucR family transcriptional regulator